MFKFGDENVALGQLIGSNRDFIEAHIPRGSMDWLPNEDAIIYLTKSAT